MSVTHFNHFRSRRLKRLPRCLCGSAIVNVAKHEICPQCWNRLPKELQDEFKRSRQYGTLDDRIAASAAIENWLKVNHQ
jgi:hypothetical protein